jgi:hypothetical protein
MTKLCPPKPKSPLLLYLSTSNSVVGCTSTRERRETQTNSGIFFFEALSGSKLFYSELEKIAYAVVMTTRKLGHYFEGHRIRAIMNQPLNS